MHDIELPTYEALPVLPLTLLGTEFSLLVCDLLEQEELADELKLVSDVTCLKLLLKRLLELFLVNLPHWEELLRFLAFVYSCFAQSF